MKLDPPGWEECGKVKPSLFDHVLSLPTCSEGSDFLGSTLTIWKPLVFFIRIGDFVLFKFMLLLPAFIDLQKFHVHVLFHQEGSKLLNC